jgi:hypothetical protein
MIVLQELTYGDLSKPWIKRYFKETCRPYAVTQDDAWKSRRLKVAHIWFRNAVTGKVERVRGYSVKYETMQRYAQKCMDDNPDRELLGMWVNHMLRKNHSKGQIPVLLPLNILRFYVNSE